MNAGAALVTALLLSAEPAAAGGTSGWKTTADVGEAALVGLAFGKTAVDQDWRGTGQLALGLGITTGVTQALKHSVHEWRPDHSDRLSFPSGHTSTAFAAAGFLHRRYGWKWGLPAAAAAALVGASRVQSKDHYWHDVVVGAAIGETTAFLIAKPRDRGVVILPWSQAGGGGLKIAARF